MDIEKAKELVEELNWSHFDMSETASDVYVEAIDIVLSELEKKDKEYEELTEASKELSKIVNLMKKVINEMAKHIYLLGYYDCLYEVCDDDMDRECEDCIKEYFYKKVKETKDNGSTRGI